MIHAVEWLMDSAVEGGVAKQEIIVIRNRTERDDGAYHAIYICPMRWGMRNVYSVSHKCCSEGSAWWPRMGLDKRIIDMWILNKNVCGGRGWAFTCQQHSFRSCRIKWLFGFGVGHCLGREMIACWSIRPNWLLSQSQQEIQLNWFCRNHLIKV